MAAFATQVELAQFMGETFDATAQARATRMLEMATQVIKSYTGQSIEAGSSTETFTGGGFGFVLTQFPVNSVTSVTVDGVVEATTNYTVERNGVLRWDWGFRGWPYGTIVEVQYTHGYATIPDDVKYVCLSLAAKGMQNAVGAVSESIGTYSVTYMNRGVVDAESPSGLTAQERALLASYTSVVVV